jgi:hypothetical protein
MPEDVADICLAGVIVYCQATKNWLKVLVAERSNNASNYRGELLGGVLSLLITSSHSQLSGSFFPRKIVL